MQNDYRNSLALLMDALDIAYRLGDKRKLAFMTGNIGRISTFTGDFAGAQKHLNINLELSTELGDRLETARAHLSLGYVQIQTADYDSARLSLDNAHLILLEVSSPHDEAIYLTYLGQLQARIDTFDEARATLEKALTRAETIAPDTMLTGRVLRHLAELNVRAGNVRAAQRQIARAFSLAENLSEKVEMGALWKLRGIVSGSLGQPKEARAAFSKSIEILAEANVPWEKADALVAAGSSSVFSERERLAYLFRAEEICSRIRLARKQEEIGRLLSALGHLESAPVSAERRPSSQVAVVDYLTANPAILKFKSQLPRLVNSDLPILLTGETGVGKDHFARYFHQVVRPGSPYLAINCASLPESLLESELFGYRRGAFTGAVANKMGLFEAADGGVLLLDEIGELPLSLQSKLLGVLETRRITPLGGTAERKLDFKLVAATNRSLEQMVEQGAFRRDLYYRLSGITYHLPPLRDRKEDIPLLLTHFMAGRSLLASDGKLPVDLVRQFVDYDWPGNIRELDNKVKRLEIMIQMVSSGDLVELSRSLFEVTKTSVRSGLFDRVEEFEQRLIVEALATAGGNKCEAARLLGVHEATIRMKLKRYGITPIASAPN